MGESKRVVDLKKEKLKKELEKPNKEINHQKVKRLQKDISRHKIWERRKRRKIRMKKLQEK